MSSESPSFKAESISKFEKESGRFPLANSTKDLIFYIKNSILIFNAIYKSDLEAICKRALNYSYIDIQKELKDRIHIYSIF